MYWCCYEYEYVYSYDVNSHAITKANTDIDNLLNIQDNASIHTSINTYIKANTTMNNPNSILVLTLKLLQIPIIIFILR